MKHFLPLILFVLISITGVAQSHRFADTTAQWYLGETENGLYCSGCYSYGTKHYTITGDTTINGKLYQKINTPQAFVPALVRDSAQKVYRLFEDRETLIYDFTKNAGDTFTLVSIWGNSYVHCTVDSVDTVQLPYPRKRMYITYDGIATYSDVWIEGVGSTNSNFLIPAIEAIVYDGSTYSLRCFYEGDSLLVHTDSINTVCLFDTFAPPSFYFSSLNAQWNVLDMFWLDATNRVYNASGDTMINGVRYQYISGDGTYGNFLRRDIDKIYKRSSSSNCEYLLYDFGMDIGDTMVLNGHGECNPINPKTAVVDSIDSVYINKWRKRMYVHYSDYGTNTGSDIWVDGIGSTGDLFLGPGYYWNIPDANEFVLLCYSENGNVLLRDSSYKFVYYFDSTSYMNSCILTRTGISEANGKVVSIYPNPTTNSFTIILSQQPQPNTAILIYNSIGALVKQEDLTTSTQQIDIAELPNGLCTYAITKQGVRQASGKLIISH